MTSQDRNAEPETHEDEYKEKLNALEVRLEALEIKGEDPNLSEFSKTLNYERVAGKLLIAAWERIQKKTKDEKDCGQWTQGEGDPDPRLMLEQLHLFVEKLEELSAQAEKYAEEKAKDVEKKGGERSNN